MTILVSVLLITVASVFLSKYIKKYSQCLYLIFTFVALVCTVHAIMIVNNYSITYIPVLKQIMKAIDSGAVGGAGFMLVMYMGVLDKKYKVTRNLMQIRAELSILSGIITIPHNVHYFFHFVLGRANLSAQVGIPLWANLMMFTAAVFAIVIMIPLFVTSFRYFRKKMTGKAWKNLQEYAYIFYGLLFIQVIMVYVLKPASMNRNFCLFFYSAVFLSYAGQKIMQVYKKKQTAIGVKVKEV